MRRTTYVRVLFAHLLILISAIQSYSQQHVTVKLILVHKRPKISSKEELGLLVDVRNTSNEKIAFYTPKGLLTDYLSYSRFSTDTKQYESIVHPSITALGKQKALADSIYRSTGMIVDFDETQDNNYDWSSDLHKEFVNNDSLWFDYTVRSGLYQSTITDKDLIKFQNNTDLTVRPHSFTLMNPFEHYQEFYNISFILDRKGQYKISLEIPKIALSINQLLIGEYFLKQPENINSQIIYFITK